MVEYDVYRKEILDFLQTVTVKFDLFADVMANRMLNELGIVIEKPKDNPYYMNLCGQYSPLDTEMYVTSVETGEQVLFSTDLKETHPKTFALFKVPSKEFETLCQTYPEQVGLIKSIVYPVENIETVISAGNFTVLTCDANLLHTNERESLLEALDKTLRYIHTRWYIADYNYEEYYPVTFMGLVWAILPQTLLDQRIRNIRTPQVHPMHIWEYLSSKGLRAYKDILNDRQALFLYRNMEYILQNKGTKRTLEILAENLLKDLQVKLVGKTILEQNVTRADECIKVPEFLSDDVVNYESNEALNESSFETMSQILYRINLEGLYPNLTNEEIQDKELMFGQTRINVIPTRLLELEKAILDTRYEKLLLSFLFDTLVYQWSLGNINYRIQFTDANVNIPVDLSFEEALALFQYIHSKESGYDLTTLPVIATIRNAYVTTKPNISTIDNKIFVDELKYRLDTIVDVERVIKEIPYNSTPYDSKSDFVEKVSEQFNVLIAHIERLRTSGNLIYHVGMNHLYKYLTVNQEIAINLVDYPNYQVWIDSTPKISQLIAAYEKLPNKKLFYVDLCDSILREMVPTEDPIFEQYTAFNKDKSALYTGLKNLFIQLCSYRLTFLETDRTTLTFITPPHLIIAPGRGEEKSGTYIPEVGSEIYVDGYDQDEIDLSNLDGIDLLQTNQSDLVKQEIPSDILLSVEVTREMGTIVDRKGVEIVNISKFQERTTTALGIGVTEYGFTTPLEGV
jgi:hypothetical protein